MDTFCLRERDLLNRFAMEVSQQQKQGESKEYSVLLFQSYQPAEDLGRAFSDRSILQTFIDVEATVPVGSLKLRVTVTDLVKICLYTCKDRTLS
ncbi:putative acyl-CoA oxidase [Rosa chinensis]|uniref:Putative acyl-CoA oxidase n=1 Tax=Rosa chinensis TaxID=74649 RepID=A0A2P6PPM4_ROSCH|nr:putative acyl-CoA oxidase [Rosa chinensis]